ncbi:MAG: hypothetical protein V3T24_03055 [Longimicrobiales bacterium]
MSTIQTQDSLDLRKRMATLVDRGDVGALEAFLAELHPSDIADVVESVDEETRLALVRALPAELASEALAEMEEGDARAELLAALEPTEGAELLHELPDDDAADLIGELEPEDQDRILA